jgi:putative ABC transport system permease protein
VSEDRDGPFVADGGDGDRPGERDRDRSEDDGDRSGDDGDRSGGDPDLFGDDGDDGRPGDGFDDDGRDGGSSDDRGSDGGGFDGDRSEGGSAPGSDRPRAGALLRLSRTMPAMLLARRNLSRNRLRSALAALGIIIGVLAIASLGMFGTTLRLGANEQLGDIGNEISVTPNQQEGVRNLTERDVTAIRRVAGGTVVPVKSKTATIVRGRDRSVTTAYGIENPGAVYEAANGRIPERLRQGVVVGSATAERFELAAGNTLSIDGETYRVVAVLREQEGITLLNPNNAVIVPPEDVEGNTYDQVVVKAETGTQANRSAVAIREELNRREQRVTIFELSSITQGIDQFFGIINAFLIGVGSISLVVAGVSILNVMLMSTVERRQEIGVLRAVGVQRGEVMRMILAEAGLLGIVGGFFGILLAIVAGIALNEYVLGDALVTFRTRNLLYLALAFAFALVTSVLSGLYPAWKAANERPVEALRK